MPEPSGPNDRVTYPQLDYHILQDQNIYTYNGAKIRINGVEISTGSTYSVIAPTGGDDTANIQAADTAMISGGKLIFLPGNYIVSSTITKSPCTVWEGLGNNARVGVTGVVISTTYNGTLIQTINPINGARGTINGIRFVFSGTPTAAIALKYVGTSGSPLVDQIVEDCYIVGFWRAIDCEWSKAMYFDRVYVENAVQDGIHLVDSSDCWFIHSQSNGQRYAIYGLRSDSFQIVDARPQVSGTADVYMEDSNFFKFSSGFADSNVSAPAGSRMAINLKNGDYFTIDAATIYSNGVDVEILIESTVGESASGGTVNGCMFHGFLGAIPIRVISAGTVSNLSITGIATKFPTVLADFRVSGAGVIDNVSISGCSGFSGIYGAQSVTNLEIAVCPGLPTIKRRSSTVIQSIDPAFLNGQIIGASKAVIHDVSGERISCPDASGLDLTASDMWAIAYIDADSWTPASVQTVASKLNSTGNQRSWEWQLSASGNLLFVFSSDGSATTITKTSTANLSAVGTPGTPLYIAYAVDINNGASGWDVVFWHSTNGSTWTQLGTTVTTAGSFPGIFNSTAELAISGVALATARRFTGKCLRFRHGTGYTGTTAPALTNDVAEYSSSIPLPTYRDAFDNKWSIKGAVTFAAI